MPALHSVLSRFTHQVSSGYSISLILEIRQRNQSVIFTRCVDLCIPSFFSFDKCVIRGSPIGFFYPVIPTQIFGQSRNPEGYFWHPTSHAYLQSRISPRFPFKIPNPEPQIRQIPHPEKLIGDPLIRLSLRKQPTFGDATTGFPARCRLFS